MSSASDADSRPPPTRRRLAENFFVLAGGEGVAKLLGFAAYATLGRRFAADEVGVYGTLEAALSVAFIASLVVEGGLAPFGARALAARPDGAAGLCARISLLRAVWCVVALLGLGAFVFAVGPTTRLGAYAVIYGAGLLAYPMILDWYLQGRNEPWLVSAPQIGRNAALLVAAAYFIEDSSHAFLAPLADGLGFFAGAVTQQLFAKPPNPFGRFGEAKRDLRGLIAETFPYLASTLFWALRVFGPMIAAGLVLSGSARDGFGAAFRLYISAHAILVLYFMNLLPSWTRRALGGEAAGLRFVRTALAASAVVVACVVVLLLSLGGTSLDPFTILRGVLRWVYGPATREFHHAASMSLFLLSAAFWAAAVGGHGRFGAIALGRPKIDLAANAAGAIGAAVVLFTMMRMSNIRESATLAYPILMGELVAGGVALIGLGRLRR